jgi:hypothetical protein
MWISVNPKPERQEIVSLAMALSGKYSQYGDFTPSINELEPTEIADLYNNADLLGLDIYAQNEQENKQ